MQKEQEYVRQRSEWQEFDGLTHTHLKLTIDMRREHQLAQHACELDCQRVDSDKRESELAKRHQQERKQKPRRLKVLFMFC